MERKIARPRLFLGGFLSTKMLFVKLDHLTMFRGEKEQPFTIHLFHWFQHAQALLVGSAIRFANWGPYSTNPNLMHNFFNGKSLKFTIYMLFSIPPGKWFFFWTTNTPTIPYNSLTWIKGHFLGGDPLPPAIGEVPTLPALGLSRSKAKTSGEIFLGVYISLVFLFST